jgi:hypothetical protein
MCASLSHPSAAHSKLALDFHASHGEEKSPTTPLRLDTAVVHLLSNPAAFASATN